MTGAHGRGDRRRRAFMSTTLHRTVSPVTLRVRMVLFAPKLHGRDIGRRGTTCSKDHELLVPKCRARTPDTTLDNQFGDVPLH